MSFREFHNNRSTEVSTATTLDLRQELQKRESQDNIFPLEIFHPKIKPFINELHTKYDIPRSYIGLAMLVTYSSAIGTAYAVSRNGSDRMYMSCWGCFHGTSSSGKSLAMDMCLAPLNEIQNDFDVEWDNATKALTDEQRQRKTMHTLIYRDAHIPTLIRWIMPENPKGVLKESDEILEWINGLNALSKKESTDEQFWLSAWNGRKYSAVRSSNLKISIPRVFTNILGGIQPKVLHKLFKNDRGDTGFIFRLLFANPETFRLASPIPGYDIPYEYKQIHSIHVKRLYNDLPVFDGYAEPKLCLLTKEATQLVIDWEREKVDNINKIRDINEMNVHAGILGKIKEYAYRFAGILAVSDKAFALKTDESYFPEKLPITEEVMVRAIKAANFFYKTAVDIYEAVDSSVTAPMEIMQIATMFKMGRTLSQMADMFIKGGATQEAKKQAMNRKLKKAIKDYPKVFGAVNHQ